MIEEREMLAGPTRKLSMSQEKNEVEKELDKDIHALRDEEQELLKMLEQKLAKAA